MRIWGYLGEKKLKDELAYHVDATTDSQGQWRCRCFRSMTFAHLYLSHPDYVCDDLFHPRRHGRPIPSEPAQPDDKPMAGLRDFSDVQVMVRRLELSGKVVDQHAKSITGAEVGWMPEQMRETFHDFLHRRSPTPRAGSGSRTSFPGK